jgi:two-component system KDP operon response regulator KdpE
LKWVAEIVLKIAETFMAHHKLLTEVRGMEYGNQREYLRTYISHLRCKIEDDPATPQYLTEPSSSSPHFIA